MTESTISDTVEAVPADLDEVSESSETESPGELSTMDLITGLDAEFQLLNDLQSTNTESMDRLLKAARAAVDGASIKLAPPPLRVVGIEERFAAADRQQLQEIAAKVRQQESRLGDVCHVLEQIVSQQQIMTTALQSVADRLTELRGAMVGETSTTRRASA